MKFEEAMEVLVKRAESISTKMPIEDKAKITNAGAKVFKRELKKETKNRHYRDRKTGSNPHLADGIMSKNKNIDGVKDGTSIVGWERKSLKGGHSKGYIANIINNGSKIPMFTTRSGRKYKNPGAIAVKADHFIDEVRDRKIVKDEILKAEAAMFANVIEKGAKK